MAGWLLATVLCFVCGIFVGVFIGAYISGEALKDEIKKGKLKMEWDGKEVKHGNS